MNTLYLDNAATTKVCDEVIEEMVTSMKNNYGNTEAKYYSFSENAKKDVMLARKRISSSLGCEVDEIVFTSGATEANNLFVKGYAESNLNKKKIIISSIEHSSILEPCLYLQSKGYDIIQINVNNKGQINLDELRREIDSNTLFVSVILVNNEIGTIQDIALIDEICSEKKVTLHVDATQAVGKIQINFDHYSSLSFMTISSHKIYGPKGIGALLIKKTNGVRTKLTPLFNGGEQENNYRAGTLANELIVGFGKAVEIACKNIEENNNKLKRLESCLLGKLSKKLNNNVIINNNFDCRIPGLLNVQFPGYNNTILLKEISPIIAASTGSACSTSKPSRVLKAIGLCDEEISWSVRLSLSRYQEEKDFDIIDDM